MQFFNTLNIKQQHIIKECFEQVYLSLDPEEISTLIGVQSDELKEIIYDWPENKLEHKVAAVVFNCLNVVLNYPAVPKNVNDKNLFSYSDKELEQILNQLEGYQTVPPLYDRDSLIEYLDQGNQVEYLFFWNQIKDAATIQADCLSQWYPAFFAVDNTIYPSAEHYMMAEKARLFNDQDTLAKIMIAQSPRMAKTLGRDVKNFNEIVWQQQRCSIVFKGNLAKFSQNSTLRTFLLSTRNKILVEASPLDPIWGIGLSADEIQARDPRQWRGLNLLGFELMRVRDVL